MKMLVLDKRLVKKNGTRFPNPTMCLRVVLAVNALSVGILHFPATSHHPWSPPVVTTQSSSPSSPSGPPLHRVIFRLHLHMSLISLLLLWPPSDAAPFISAPCLLHSFSVFSRLSSRESTFCFLWVNSIFRV